jgi:predicted transcriptional regulator
MKAMKKIKSIKHLNAERKRLEERKAELEKAIKYDWRDVKDSLRPGNIASQVFASVCNNAGTTVNDNISDSISRMVAAFTKKMVEKAEKKFGSWFSR